MIDRTLNNTRMAPILNHSRYEQTKMQRHCQQYRSNLTNGKAENDKWLNYFAGL